MVNENDTVAVQELRFGDNDTLSAQVATLVQADWLFLLTDVRLCAAAPFRCRRRRRFCRRRQQPPALFTSILVLLRALKSPFSLLQT